MPRPSPVACAALALAAWLLVACGARYARQPVWSAGGIEVALRSQTRGGEPVDRGFAHPVVISGARMAHILSRIDVRKDGDKDGERQPAIPAELVYDLGDALATALGKATPAQDVVAQARRRERTLGIFTQEYLTSVLVYARGDRLHVFLQRLDAPVEKTSDLREEPLGEPDPSRLDGHFRVIGSEAMTPTSAQEVAVDWRDPVFREATALRVGPGGRVLRRTILMDSPAEALPDAGPAELPPGLSADTLRKLSDLEAQRERGEISESEYRTRRREILSGEGH
jgi:hypothetical protein